MARKTDKPEEMVGKLRQVDVPVSQGRAVSAIRIRGCAVDLLPLAT
jgi:hypothetical protein